MSKTIAPPVKSNLDPDNPLPLPAMKSDDWPTFLLWSEAVSFLRTECRLRESEARRELAGRRPRIRIHGTVGSFKRWHLKTLLLWRENNWHNRNNSPEELASENSED